MRFMHEKPAIAISCALSLTACLAPALGEPAVVEFGKSTAIDGETNHQFGSIQAISGDYFFLGSPRRNRDGIPDTGGVQIYQLIDGEPALVQELVPPPDVPGELFGNGLSAHGDILVVNALQDVHVFRLIDGIWIPETVMEWAYPLPPTAQSVAVYGDRIAIVNAYRFSIFSSLQSYLAVYRHNGAGWMIEQVIENHVPYIGYGFGESIQMNDRFLVLGLSYYGAGNLLRTGGLDIYKYGPTELGGDSWEYLERLVADDVVENDQFALDYDLDGDSLIAGSWRSNGVDRNDGAAYVFEFDGSRWLQVQKLSDPNGRRGAKFGYSVAINGGHAVVGSSSGQGEAGDEHGTALLFEHGQFGWNPLSTFYADNLARIDGFGSALALHESRLLVGAIGDNTHGLDSGAAYFFTICGADLNGDGMIDTTDLGILIDAYGEKNERLDFSGDGLVDSADLGLLISEFGADCP